MSEKITRHSKKLTIRQLNTLMENALFGMAYLCFECDTQIDPDQHYCIECGLNNPLVEEGLI